MSHKCLGTHTRLFPRFYTDFLELLRIRFIHTPDGFLLNFIQTKFAPGTARCEIIFKGSNLARNEYLVYLFLYVGMTQALNRLCLRRLLQQVPLELSTFRRPVKHRLKKSSVLF